MKGILSLVSLVTLLSQQTQAQFTIFEQPPGSAGGLLPSARWEPDGSDWDAFVWESFTLSSAQPVAEITWRGGYDPLKFGSGGPVVDFTVAIYPSIPGGSQPDLLNPPLLQQLTLGNADQTLAGEFNGTTLYDYNLTLSTAFTPAPNTTYWLQVEAHQNALPDWGLATGSGGNGTHFRRIYADGVRYQIAPGDAAFSLVSPVPEPALSTIAAALALAGFACRRGTKGWRSFSACRGGRAEGHVGSRSTF
jgi:hypothetical protein